MFLFKLFIRLKNFISVRERMECGVEMESERERERVNDVLRKGELFACYSVFGCITVTILLIFCVNLCVHFVSLIKLQCSHVYWYLWFLFSVSWIVLNRFLSFFGWWMEDVLFFVQLSICGLCTFLSWYICF